MLELVLVGGMLHLARRWQISGYISIRELELSQRAVVGHAFLRTCIIWSIVETDCRLPWLGWMLLVGGLKGTSVVLFDRAMRLASLRFPLLWLPCSAGPGSRWCGVASIAEGCLHIIKAVHCDRVMS